MTFRSAPIAKPESSPVKSGRKNNPSRNEKLLPAKHKPDAMGSERINHAEREIQNSIATPSAVSGQTGAAIPQLATGIGKPLPPNYRAMAQKRFGVDLSKVRVHDDAAARHTAKEQGAKALASGDHILLGESAQPGKPEHADVLSHEVVHSVQQAKPGAGQELFKDTESTAGLGREPPSEHFVRHTGTGAEEGHLLFGNDSASLSEAARTHILEILGDTSEPMTIHLHGYADSSGGNEYNFNLSAHRAVAVKRFLESVLPEGSRVIAFAYGETAEFGAEAAENRRVGIDVVQRGSDSPVMGGLSLMPPPSLAPGLGFSLDLNLQLGGGSPSLMPTSPSALGPRLPGLDPDFFRSPTDPIYSPFSAYPFQPGDIASSYAFRGLTLSTRDLSNYENHFNFWRDTFFRMGFGAERSVWLAQKGVDFAAANILSLEHPTRFELEDRRMDTEPTILPALPALEWMIGQILSNPDFNMTRF